LINTIGELSCNVDICNGITLFFIGGYSTELTSRLCNFCVALYYTSKPRDTSFSLYPTVAADV